MKQIKIGNITIGEGLPSVIIAEAACEHRGNMDSAKRLICAAKEAGADIVKFQLHVPEAEMVPDSIQFWAGSMDDVLKEVNFEKVEEHKELKNYCEKIGIQYICTPFCIAASDILEEVGVDAYKLGSGELSNIPMVRHIAQKGKPMIVSTGMSTIEEIAETVEVLNEESADFMLTHAISEYPADYAHLNLGAMAVMRSKFDVMVGYSDHTNDVYSAVAAVALGANVIEKHFTIRDLKGPDDLVSLDPSEFKEMVGAIRKVEKALGTRKKIYPKSKEVRDWAFHSVVASCDIKKGEELTSDNLMPKRPGSGIEAKFLDPKYSKKLVGKKAKKDLSKNTILQWTDVA